MMVPSSAFSDLTALLRDSVELKLFDYLLGCYSRLRAEERNEVITLFLEFLGGSLNPSDYR